MNDKEVFVAISYALHEELGKCVHDQESFVLTIKQPKFTAWNMKTQTMRVLPNK